MVKRINFESVPNDKKYTLEILKVEKSLIMFIFRQEGVGEIKTFSVI